MATAKKVGFLYKFVELSINITNAYIKTALNAATPNQRPHARRTAIPNTPAKQHESKVRNSNVAVIDCNRLPRPTPWVAMAHTAKANTEVKRMKSIESRL